MASSSSMNKISRDPFLFVKKIFLRSKNGEKFEVQEPVARMSKVVENRIEDRSEDDIIPLPQRRFGDLEYCNFYGGVPSVVVEGVDPKNFSKYYDDTAANYLSIKPLLDMMCQTVAEMMEEKTIQEISDLFHIKNEYTPEEEEELKQEFDFVLEK